MCIHWNFRPNVRFPIHYRTILLQMFHHEQFWLWTLKSALAHGWRVKHRKRTSTARAGTPLLIVYPKKWGMQKNGHVLSFFSSCSRNNRLRYWVCLKAANFCNCAVQCVKKYLQKGKYGWINLKLSYVLPNALKFSHNVGYYLSADQGNWVYEVSDGFWYMLYSSMIIE